MRFIYKTALHVSLAALVGSLVYFGYTAWHTYQALYHKQAPRELSSDEIARNKERIINVLVAGGISALDAVRGFWLRYTDSNGVEQVVFIDTDALSLKGLTEWQIGQLVNLIKTYSVASRDSVRLLSNDELPSIYQYHNALYSFDENGEFLRLQHELEQQITNKDYTAETLFRLGYLYEIQAKYDARDELYARACKEFGTYCKPNIRIQVVGRVLDGDGNAIPSATVSVVGGTDTHTVTTNAQGEYTLMTSIQEMSRVRVLAQKRLYSDGMANVAVVVAGKETYRMEDITLTHSLGVVTLDTRTHSVSGADISYSDNNFVIRTPQVTYYMPPDIFVHKDGSPYQGEVNVALYDFNRATAPNSLLNVDALDAPTGFAGDMLITFGMSDVRLFTPSGEELYILRSKPGRLVQKMANLDLVMMETHVNGRAMKTDDMQMLVDASWRHDFPVDRAFLLAHKFDGFPAYWSFDPVAGVWDNIGVNYIDTEGTKEAPLYIINDMR